MDSTGGFLEALMTGMIVAMKAITKAIAIIKPTVIGLNCKMEIPIWSTNERSMKNWAMKAAIMDITEQTAAMNKDSTKKILKTSLFLAPIALRIPISFFLPATDTVIKLRSINAAKTPKPTPIQKKMVLSMAIISTMKLTVAYLELVK